MNLDVSTWKDFSINKLFSVEAGKYYYSDEYTDGDTPYCSASAENNGISKKIDLPPDFNGNQIITGKVGCTSFYEAQPFCATSDVNVLTPRFEMSQAVALFLVTIINKNENYRWNYGRQCRVSNTKKINIKLPVQYDLDGNPVIDKNKLFSDEGFIPDWQWMENYIKSLHHKPISTKISTAIKNEISTHNWQYFKLKDIFVIKKGKRLTAEDQTDGETPYIGAIDNNNGVSNYIGQDAIHEGNTISLSYNGSVGEAFYQPKPFWATDDVNVLYFKKTNGITFNKYIALFICTVLRCEQYRFCYGRKWTLESMKASNIKLPVSSNGKPDWCYMEEYIKSLPFSDRI